VRTLTIAAIAVALFLMPAARPPVTEALGKLLGNPQNLSNTDDQSEAPQITVGSDIVGVSWGERGDERIGTDRTTVGSSFGAASFIDASGAYIKTQWPDIAADSAGNLHLAYAIGDQVLYRVKPKGGSWSSSRPVASSSSPNPVRIAVGSNNLIWITWRDANGDSVYYRRSSNGINWTNGSDGGVVYSESGNMFSPDIAVGPDNVPHVVWYIRTSGSHTGDIRIGDWNGSGFTTSSVTTDGSSAGKYDADPSISVDQQNTLHVVWRKQLKADGTSWAITYARRVSGQGWTSFTPIAITNADAQYAPSIGTDEVSNVYVVYSNPIGSKNRQIVFYGKSSSGSWEGPVPLPNVRWDSRNSITGKAGIAHIAYQTELVSDQAEVQYARISFAATPTLSAQPVIEGGKSGTNKNPVSVAFSSIQGSPKEVRWRWGAAPTDALNDSSGWQAFTNPKSIPLPSNPSVCQALTLYTQVKDGSTIEATAKTDAIVFDNAIQATVEVLNPHLATLPQTFASVADLPDQSASDGDPGYTRNKDAFLRITDAGDCSGLVDFTVVGSNPPKSNPVFTNGVYQGKITLPQVNNIAPGTTIPINVVVIDGAGNLEPSFPLSIIYDPQNTSTDPATPNTDGLPKLNSNTPPTVDTGNSIIRTLTFSNVNVTDNVYGPKEGLSSTRQFWGVWIANATTDVGANNASLMWFPVRVPNPNASPFTVQWNVFSGLNIGPDRNKPGDYFVYVRFLDGAGNPSSTALPVVKVTLAPGYTIPTYALPLIRK